MLSRIIIFESHLNLRKNLRPAFCLSFPEGKKNNGNYGTTRACPNQNKTSISKHVRSPGPSFGEKAKEATKTTYYTAVVVAGLGAFGLMMYAIFRELISSFSPQSVYSAAVDRLIADPKVASLFGENIKCFGETSRRGRRQHVTHLPYEVDGRKGFRIKFYLQGQYRAGSVHLDARETPSSWEFRYLFVQSDSYPNEVVVVEDNRGGMEEASSGSGAPLHALPPRLPPRAQS